MEMIVARRINIKQTCQQVSGKGSQVAAAECNSRHKCPFTGGCPALQEGGGRRIHGSLKNVQISTSKLPG